MKMVNAEEIIGTICLLLIVFLGLIGSSDAGFSAGLDVAHRGCNYELLGYTDMQMNRCVEFSTDMANNCEWGKLDFKYDDERERLMSVCIDQSQKGASGGGAEWSIEFDYTTEDSE